MPEPGARTKAPSFSDRLLAWYDHRARVLPWRTGPAERARGLRPDPYRVWLSEIMLQQTTVEAVKPHFDRFLAAWPNVAALAAASLEDVLSAWAGLGYYSRARNLHRAAQTIHRDHGGSFPDDIAALRALPGIGDYTAGAIAAIAFDRPALAVDGNVDRVMARQLMLGVPPAAAKPAIRAHLATLAPAHRHGDFAQALMDLGATVCMPRRADCGSCPVADGCAARAGGNPLDFPVRARKPARPRRRAAAFVAIALDGAILLRRRPERGLLAGMSEPPTSHFSSRSDGETGIEAAPFPADWQGCGSVTHLFTHFELDLHVWCARTDRFPAPQGMRWAEPGEFDREALPTVMRKAIGLALESCRARPA